VTGENVARDERGTNWSLWSELLIEALLVGFFWGYALWSGFAVVEVLAAVLVTCWILGTYIWRFLRGDDRGPQASTQAPDQWTTGQILGIASEPLLFLIYPWAVAAKEGLATAWGVFALVLTAGAAIIVIKEILEGPNPPERPFKGRIEDIPMHHDDAAVRHDFPGMR
jgi:hypothetical protein